MVDFWVVSMERKYFKRGSLRVPLGVQIVAFAVYGLSSFLDVTEKVVEMSNYGSLGRQKVLTREYEDKRDEAERKYVVKGLDGFVGGVDGKI